MRSRTLSQLRVLVAQRIRSQLPNLSTSKIAYELDLERSPNPVFPFNLRFRCNHMIDVAKIDTCDHIKALWIDTKNEKKDLCVAISQENLIRSILEPILDKSDSLSEELTKQSLSPKSRFLIEFGSPNVAKRLHAGHLRSTLIGNSIANIAERLGHDVIKLNWVGDWGTQFGLILASINENNDNKNKHNEDSALTMDNLASLYIRANALAEKEPNFRAKALSLVAALERTGRVEEHLSYSQIRKLTLESLQKMYDRLNVKYDVYHFESQYIDKVKQSLLPELEEKGMLEVDEEGRKVVHLHKETVEKDTSNNKVNKETLNEIDKETKKEEKRRNKKAVLLKSDGASLYLTRDLAAALHRNDIFDFDRMLYVVEQAQHEHFGQLFELISLLRPDLRPKVDYVNFGRVQGMSSRSGTAVEVDAILDEALKRIVEQRQTSPNTRRIDDEDDKERNDDIVDEILATSCVILNVLNTSRRANHVFKWKNALRSKGNSSAVRVQYTHCRLHSLLEATQTLSSSSLPSLEPLLESERALDLLVGLANMESSLHKSLEELEPIHAMTYLFELCDLINLALKELRVKDEADHQKALARRILFKASKVVLADIMRVVGLRPLDQM